MYQSIASSVLMIKPKAFGYNPQTAEDNHFMARSDQFATLIHQTACKEFDMLVKLLTGKGIEVIVEEDTDEPKKPDAIFPNWVSFHNSGKVVLYPLKAPNRHPERRLDIIKKLTDVHGFLQTDLIDYTHYENEGKFLEGMGSMVIDRLNRIAYSCLSPRTNQELVEKFCHDFNFTPVIFRAEHEINGTSHTLYYTNVMISFCDQFALVSSSLIPDNKEREMVNAELRKTGREIIEIDNEQTKNFLANAISLKNKEGDHFLVMSKRAHKTLRPEQEERISRYAEILSCDVGTIEMYGGASIRSMVAEIFLPRK